eukprot:2030814-Alexandrium_andersonii.AAC.1
MPGGPVGAIVPLGSTALPGLIWTARAVSAARVASLLPLWIGSSQGVALASRSIRAPRLAGG